MNWNNFQESCCGLTEALPAFAWRDWGETQMLQHNQCPGLLILKLWKI